MSRQEDGYVHPLMLRPMSASSAPELLELWTREMAKSCPDAGNLSGILYRVPDFRSEDLLLLCFDIADGYRMGASSFRISDERRSHPYPDELRFSVAQQAFWALCEGLFKDKGAKCADSPSWEDMVRKERVFQKILWFVFDEDRRPTGTYQNVPSRPDAFASNKHQQEVFHKFLVEMVEFVWGISEIESLKDIFGGSRPSLIRILYKIGRLDLLNSLCSIGDRRYRCGLSAEERHTLRELAIGGLSENGGKNRWKYVEEAVARGDKAAEFLWCYMPWVKYQRVRLSEKRLQEKARAVKRAQKERERLEQEHAEAEEKLKALSN